MPSSFLLNRVGKASRLQAAELVAEASRTARPDLSASCQLSCFLSCVEGEFRESHSWTKRILSHVMEIVYAADCLLSNRSLSHLSIVKVPSSLA